MQNLKISSQIGLGFGVILAILALASGFAIYQMFKIADVFNDYRGTARQTITLNDFAEDLFEARMAAFRFKADGNAQSAEAVQSNFDEIIRDLEKTAPIFESNRTLLDELRSYAADVEVYQSAFARTRVLEGEIVALDATLAETGLAARELLTEIMASAYEDGDNQAAFYAGRAQQEVMLARFYMARFIDKRVVESYNEAMAHAARATEEVSTLRAALEDPSRRELSEQLMTRITEFRAASGQLQERIIEQERLRDGTLDRIGPRMQDGFEGLVERVVLLQNTLGPEAKSQFVWAKIMIAIASALTLIIGIIAAYTIGRRLSKTFTGLTGKMNKLAEGNFDVEIWGIDAPNEAGDMARAMEVFKTAGRERELLHKDREKVEEEEKRWL
ncbi:MAG: hypothetical protein AAF908_04660, partial [Pseudomonadota bacterium]